MLSRPRYWPLGHRGLRKHGTLTTRVIADGTVARHRGARATVPSGGLVRRPFSGDADAGATLPPAGKAEECQADAGRHQGRRFRRVAHAAASTTATTATSAAAGRRHGGPATATAASTTASSATSAGVGENVDVRG